MQCFYSAMIDVVFVNDLLCFEKGMLLYLRLQLGLEVHSSIVCGLTP